MFQPSLFFFIPTPDSVAQCCANYFLLFGKIPAFSRFSTGERTKLAWVSSRSPVCICIVFPFVFALAFVFPFVFGFGSCMEQLTHHLYAICLCFKAIPMKGAQHSVLNSVSNLFHTHSTLNMKRAQISILSFELCKQWKLESQFLLPSHRCSMTSLDIWKRDFLTVPWVFSL